MEVQLAEREAELAQCRGQLHRTEQLLDKARQAAANQFAAEAAAPAPAQPQAASPAAKPGAQEDFSFAAGCDTTTNLFTCSAQTHCCMCFRQAFARLYCCKIASASFKSVLYVT